MKKAVKRKSTGVDQDVDQKKKAVGDVGHLEKCRLVDDPAFFYLVDVDQHAFFYWSMSTTAFFYLHVEIT